MLKSLLITLIPLTSAFNFTKLRKLSANVSTDLVQPLASYEDIKLIVNEYSDNYCLDDIVEQDEYDANICYTEDDFSLKLVSCDITYAYVKIYDDTDCQILLDTISIETNDCDSGMMFLCVDETWEDVAKAFGVFVIVIICLCSCLCMCEVIKYLCCQKTRQRVIMQQPIRAQPPQYMPGTNYV